VLEAAPEALLLPGVAEPCERQAQAGRTVEVERAADRLRASDRHHGHAFGREVATAPFGQRLDRAPVAETFDEDDGAHVVGPSRSPGVHEPDLRRG
jgi:hypothetical protein